MMIDFIFNLFIASILLIFTIIALAIAIVAGAALAVLIGVLIAIVTRKENWAVKLLKEMEVI